MTDLVSVIVPVFNVHQSLLEACLDAILRQTLRRNEYEIIIVDDCSTDATSITILQEFSSRASNIKLIRHSENKGLNEARRTGVAAASGDYVLFVDGDDILTRDAVENLRIEAVKTNADIVTAQFFRWNSTNKTYCDLPFMGEPLPAEYISRLKTMLGAERSFTMCGRLFRRSVLGDDALDLPIGQLHEDVTTFARVLFKSKVVSHVNRQIYYYTLNSASITGSFSLKHAEGIFYALEDWVENAKRHELLGKLSGAMAKGAERLANTCVERCVFSNNMSVEEKARILDFIATKYAALSLPRSKPVLQGMKFLARYKATGLSAQAARLMEEVALCFPSGNPTRDKPDSLLERGLGPSEMACRLKDKIVFICQVDYQIRNAAIFARELRLRGHPCVVLDNSSFASGGLRQLPPNEHDIFWRTEHIKIEQSPYEPDWLSSAKLVIVFNDFNDDFREALEYRHRLSLPSICMIEGINDFLRLDTEGRRYLPYRRCDFVFLAGKDDAKYFEDRKTYVVGLPIVESLSKKIASFPEKPIAILNVNFTYGVLEHEREGFVAKAQRAFAAAGIDWVITQHPMDKGEFAKPHLSKLTQYELIDQGTVFVSRFATGILEALASGKPAIYFNPHGEKVEKFKVPHGAFEIATNEEQLVVALRKTLSEVRNGVDFRKRALPFLERHADYSPDRPVIAERFADAAIDVLNATDGLQKSISELFFNRFQVQESVSLDTSGQVFGGLGRRHKAQLNEEELIGRYFAERGSVMIDVGANFGNSLDIYLGKGWTVHAFEPDPYNRKRLLEAWPSCARLTVNEEAVSDKVGQKLPFFASAESTGVSGLSAFTKEHRQICEVVTTTLCDYYEKRNLSHVDFLKIDVEGFDKFVLDGFPWEKDKPEVVLAEFEDEKTVPLGYTTHDLANLIIRHGYSVYVSEWLPIVRYGIAHDWRRLVRYSPDLDVSKTWGNIIGFLEDPGERTIKSLAMQTVKFAARPSLPEFYTSAETSAHAISRAARTSMKTLSPLSSTPLPRQHIRPFYAGFGEWLMWRSPRLFTFLQRWRRRIAAAPGRLRYRYGLFALWAREKSPLVFRVGQAGAWLLRAALRRKVVALSMLAILATLILLPFVGASSWNWRLVLWAAAGLLMGLASGAVLFKEATRRVIAAQEQAIQHVIRTARQATDQRCNVLEKHIEKLEKSIEAIKIETGNATEAARAERATINNFLDKERRFSNYANAASVRSHKRQLCAADIQHINKNWLPLLGLSLPGKQLQYLAHQICLAEERCEGRMATTIQAAMLRTLALLSVPKKNIEILEIGTLFGIAAGTLYRAGLRDQRDVRLTLIDPLEGYYGEDLKDPATGVPITHQTLINNFAALGIQDEHYRIIQGHSTDAKVLEAAATRHYDYLLIDGDHSVEGVARDFELYGSLVRPGGMLIFDDYDTVDWPAIKPFVDEHVRPNNDWQWIGGEWRTAILRRKQTTD